MTDVGDIEQFEGKIYTHHPQQVGAKFWTACRKLSHLPQVPFCESHGTASYYVCWTGQATIGAHISDELTRSKCHSGAAIKDGFELSGNYDDSLGYELTLLENNLLRRAIDPSGEAD